MTNYLKPILFFTFFAGTNYVCAASRHLSGDLSCDISGDLSRYPVVAERVLPADNFMDFFQRAQQAHKDVEMARRYNSYKGTDEQEKICAAVKACAESLSDVLKGPVEITADPLNGTERRFAKDIDPAQLNPGIFKVFSLVAINRRIRGIVRNLDELRLELLRKIPRDMA